jgi:hypothetical protein
MKTTAKQKRTRSRNLTACELETTISFSQGSDIADVFTYEKTWQKRLEQGLRLRATLINDSGGRGYQLPKSLIVMPRAKRKYSEETKKKMAQRLAKIRRKQPALS